jgi:flavodoxin
MSVIPEDQNLEILIVFTSESGNTKKVVNMLQKELELKKYSVTVKNALTTTEEHLHDADLVLIGTPVHGYILFGQKPADAVRKMLDTGLPKDLHQKRFIGFATYLFFPAATLNRVKNAIISRNGKYLSSFSNRRSKKEALVKEITEYIIHLQAPS